MRAAIFFLAIVSTMATAQIKAINNELVCWYMDLQVRWEVEELPIKEIAPGIVLTSAAMTALEVGKECDSACTPLDSDADGMSADLCKEEAIGASAAVTGCLGCDSSIGTGVGATAHATKTSGQVQVSSRSAAYKQTILTIECEELYDCLTLNLGIVSASSTVTWEFYSSLGQSVPIAFEVEVPQAGLVNSFLVPCGPPVTPQGMGRSGSFIAIEGWAKDSLGESLGEWAHQGYIDSDGIDDINVGGFFDSEDFTLEPQKDRLELSGTTELGSSIPTGARYAGLTVRYVELGRRDGVISTTGYRCQEARELMRSTFNLELGDPGFDPRVDFNRDNIVDADDLDLFNKMPCSADFNCDGTVDYFDTQAFLAAYSNMDIEADMNYDTVIDFFDVQMFLASYAVGCK
ncbi:MAG: hypothetical protein KF757_14315 [Phycisphaeraceae bacterium]|nr:hypothetical protein [Phycisphaeraceae bacterium]MCW5762923.1 hypothetical protein [Phycisphaeraceae bacterium]